MDVNFLNTMIPDELSDYHDPQEVPGVSVLTSRVRRFHDCLDEAMERHRDKEDDELFAVAVLQDLAEGCRQMGLEQDFGARLAGFQSIFHKDEELIKTAFKTAYLKKQLKAIPLKFRVTEGQVPRHLNTLDQTAS